MKETVTLGAIGVTSTWGGAAVAFFSSATTVLSFFSVLVGLTIGIITLYRMLKHPPENKR